MNFAVPLSIYYYCVRFLERVMAGEPFAIGCVVLGVMLPFLIPMFRSFLTGQK